MTERHLNYYTIRHSTEYRYHHPVSESITEVRKQPRSEGHQRCLSFDLKVTPRAHIHHYRDFYGNIVHHFDIPQPHPRLSIKAKAVVEVRSPPDLPLSLSGDAWDELDRMTEGQQYYFELQPSKFTQSSDRLRELTRELRVEGRRDDPLSLVRELNASIYQHFDYAPQTTRVDSHIDDALRMGKGVCQDFAHIMIAILREYLKIPCRYVSGYLFHMVSKDDRSAADATHAWVEVLIPGHGWVGFDPTNNLIAEERHIRAAVGRDYGDVPPTRGILKGSAESDLSVAVEVVPCEAPDDVPEINSFITPPPADQVNPQQQQQQQQQ